MVRTLLIRGMLVGIVAGLLTFSFGKVFGEPQVDRAITFETALDEAKAKAEEAKGMQPVEEPELVSREVQASLGLFTGVMFYSIAFGGLFALVFAAADRRIADVGPRETAALLAALGIVAVYIVPNLKYPANPPSVGQPDTIGVRTALYFIIMVTSIAAMIGAMVVRKRLAPRIGVWSAALIAVGFYSVVVAVVARLLPGINEVPDEFPAVVLWQFRIASLGMQLVMWATIGLLFGWATERAFAGRRSLLAGQQMKAAMR
jgi:predicted cobalt transporter CbtA